MGIIRHTHHVQFNCTLDIPRKYLQTGPERGQRVNGIKCYISAMHVHCLILQYRDHQLASQKTQELDSLPSNPPLPLYIALS